MAGATEESIPARSRGRIGHRLIRVAGTVLVVVGAGMLVWTFVVWRWSDPFTSVYTRWQQHQLTTEHRQLVKAFRPAPPIPEQTSPAKEAKAVARNARRFRAAAEAGAPIGRLVVPQLGLNMLFVNGTDTADLRKGPGRDERTYMPGQGELVYIAGHRTTYGARLRTSNA